MASWKDGLSFQILLLALGGLVGEYIKKLWIKLAILVIAIIVGIGEYCIWPVKGTILPIQSSPSQLENGNSFFGSLLFSINVFLSKTFSKNLKKDKDPVFAMGPFGNPSGGQSFDYNGHGSIKSLIVRCGIIVDSIEVIFKKEDYLFSKRAGVGGGEYHEISLEVNEHITEVEGSYGTWLHYTTNYNVILTIAFTTNMGNSFGPYGISSSKAVTEKGHFHERSGKLVGIFGTTTYRYISSIGFYFQQ